MSKIFRSVDLVGRTMMNDGNKMTNIRSIGTTPAMLLMMTVACTSTDKRIDSNYSNLQDNREAMYSLNQVLEASADEPPAWMLTYLDSWDCEDNFCTVGRAEISADNASPFTCLDVARIKAKANLVSVIQTDISNKVIAGAEGFKISQQSLKQITVEGFEIRNLANVRITGNYYQKVLKHSNESPQAFYQCFSVASISKFNLQNLITQKANKHLNPDVSKEFKHQMDQEWNRFFKINGNDHGQVKFEDMEARQSIASDLTKGGLSNIQENVVRVAKAFLNMPYQLGGDIADGSLDCSNYVKTVYSVFGLKLPRTSPEQYSYANGDAVTANDLQAGDLLFFNGSLRPADQPSHVGIYLGNGEFINANGSATARKVQVDDFTSSYWQEKFLGARRVINSSNFSASNVAQAN